MPPTFRYLVSASTFVPGTLTNAGSLIAPPLTLQFPPLGPTLRLRPLSTGDVGELFALVERNRLYLRQWLPWLDSTRAPADVTRFLTSAERQWHEGDGFHLAITQNDQIIGVIGHNRIDWPNRIATLGYWLSEERQGQGIMSAACRYVVDHAFEALEVNRVEIRCASLNLQSRAIPMRLGFSHEGTRHEAEWLYDHFVDHEIYALLRRDRKGSPP